MPREASSAQLLLVESLLTRAGASRLTIGDVVSSADASAAIERLQRLVPISANSRAGAFAVLKYAGRTYDDAKAALGINSLSDGSGATEYDAARIRAWADGFTTEVRRAVTHPQLFKAPLLDGPRPDGMDDLASLEAAIHASPSSPTPYAAKEPPKEPTVVPSTVRPAASRRATGPRPNPCRRPLRWSRRPRRGPQDGRDYSPAWKSRTDPTSAISPVRGS